VLCEDRSKFTTHSEAFCGTVGKQKQQLTPV